MMIFEIEELENNLNTLVSLALSVGVVTLTTFYCCKKAKKTPIQNDKMHSSTPLQAETDKQHEAISQLFAKSSEQRSAKLKQPWTTERFRSRHLP